VSAGRKLRITPEARRWLEQRGGEVTVRPSPRHGCCGGMAEVPVAEARRPERPEDYDAFQVDGMRVYLARTLEVAGPIELRLETLMGFGRLFVEVDLPAPGAADDQQEPDDV